MDIAIEPGLSWFAIRTFFWKQQDAAKLSDQARRWQLQRGHFGATPDQPYLLSTAAEFWAHLFLLLYKRVLYEERFPLELSQFGFFLFSGLLGAGVCEWFCSLLRNQESKNACLPSHITLSKMALPGAE